MKKLSFYFTILALLTASLSYGWTIKESKQDEDVKIIVNDGGTFKEALTVDGATGDVSFLNPPKVGSLSMLHIVASGDSTGSSIIAGPLTTCTAPSAPTIVQLQWVKLSNGQMYAWGETNTVTNQNGGCGVSVEITLPQSFSSNFSATCGAGAQNNSTTGPSGYQRCMIANDRFVSPYTNKLRIVTTHEGSWTAGNLQQVRIYFQAWGLY